MEENYLSIGQMAKMNNTTVSTLRLYDEMDLLKPIYVSPESGYRYYDIKQNARLDLISYMKELQMNLKDIKEVLDKEDLNLIEAILIKKRKQLESDILNLERKKDAISRTIYSLERYRQSPKAGTITVEYIDKRRIYKKETDINFYDYSIDMYEKLLKDFKKHLLDEGLPQVYYINTGTFLKKENFLSLNFISDAMFIFVDDYFPLKDEIDELENGFYACIYIDDFDLEKDYAKKLLDYCMKNDFIITGDYICEVLTEINFFSDEKRNMFFRLQVPILFQK